VPRAGLLGDRFERAHENLGPHRDRPEASGFGRMPTRSQQVERPRAGVELRERPFRLVGAGADLPTTVGAAGKELYDLKPRFKTLFSSLIVLFASALPSGR